MSKTIILSFPDFPEDTDILIENDAPFYIKGQFSAEINSEFFAAKLAKMYDMVFFPMDGWFEFQNGRWTSLRESDLEKRIRDLLKTEMRRNDVHSHDKISKSICPIMNSLKTICDHGETIPALPPDVIPVKNGVLEWNESEKQFVYRPYRRDDMIFHSLNAAYDSKAQSGLFMKKIKEIIPDEADRRVVQEYLGASLFSENRTRKFLALIGEGGCGKSLLVRLLTGIMTVARTFDLNFSEIADKFAFSALRTQTLLTASEAASQAFLQRSGIEFVKRATGGDFFQSDLKYKNFRIDHHGFFSLIVVSNNKLLFQYDGKGEEFKDRLIVVQFNKHIDSDKQDKDLAEKLLQDRSAILNWLLEGAQRVREKKWNITLTPSQISRRDRIINATKGIEIFVRNHIRFDAGNALPIQEAYQAYAKLCITVGFECMTEKTFQHRFHNAMLEILGSVPCNTIRLRNGNVVRGYKHYTITL